MIAVHELLLAKAHELIGSEKMSTFQRSHGAKRPTRPTRTLILDASNGSMVAPIEITREVVGRQDRSLLSVGGKAKRLKTKELAAKLRRSKIGEPGDAVDGGGVQLLVRLGAEQVFLEDTEAVVVLLLRGVSLAEFGLEGGEVVLRVEQVVLHLRHHLTDQKVVFIVDPFGGDYCRREKKETEEQ